MIRKLNVSRPNYEWSRKRVYYDPNMHNYVKKNQN